MRSHSSLASRGRVHGRSKNTVVPKTNRNTVGIFFVCFIRNTLYFMRNTCAIMGQYEKSPSHSSKRVGTHASGGKHHQCTRSRFGPSTDYVRHCGGHGAIRILLCHKKRHLFATARQHRRPVYGHLCVRSKKTIV